MKVVFAHTDFRIYWPARLEALNVTLKTSGIEFAVIEIAGGGSPYSFSVGNPIRPSFWHCLFPDNQMEEINSKLANMALRLKLDELHPDIVFAGAIAFPSGAGAIRWANENKKKVVIFDNARLQDVPRMKIINFIKREIYKGADAILCPAQDWNSTFNYFGFKNDQIFHGLNVVDNEFWSYEAGDIRKKTQDQYYLTVGRQVEKKNFLFLLEEYREYCRTSHSPSGLYLVGNGPRREVLENYVKRHNLRSVRFIPFTSQDKLKDLYRNAKCFILPSRHGETWGLVVNEAMSSGLPVLVSDQVGCASTLVRNGFNGYTFSPDHFSGLTELMKNIDSLPLDQLSDMGRNSLEIIKNWGLDRFCSGVYDAIEFVNSRENSRVGPLSKIIIKLWRGRYRPT